MTHASKYMQHTLSNDSMNNYAKHKRPVSPPSTDASASTSNPIVHKPRIDRKPPSTILLSIFSDGGVSAPCDSVACDFVTPATMHRWAVAGVKTSNL